MNRQQRLQLVIVLILVGLLLSGCPSTPTPFPEDCKNAAQSCESAGQCNETAVSLISAENYTCALEYVNRAIELDPKDSGYWTNKALILAALGKYNDALESANTALQLDPSNAAAWSAKGSALDGLGRYVEALDSFNKALDLEPDSPWIMSNRMASLQEFSTKGKPEDIETFLNSDKKDANNLFCKAVMQAAKEKYQDCVLNSREVTSLQPGNAAAWSIKGFCIMFANEDLAYAPFTPEHQEAVEALETAIKLGLDPTAKQNAEELLKALK